PDGYLGLLRPDARVFALWDIHEMGYLIYGLTMDHRFFGEQASLEAARKLANYLIDRWSAEPDREPGGGMITVHMAVTGVESAMLALHDATQDRRYLDFCVQMRKLPEWNARIVTGRHGQIEGHAYAHICRCIAQLRLNRLQPDQRLLKPAHDVIDFLTGHDGLVITGACGDHECWHDTQEGTLNLGETCATAYLIRMLDELLRMEGRPLYGDLMERAIYNALFAAQSPDGRRIRYYSPFDGPREYFKGDTYCCPCNYRRIVAELPGMICYRAGDGVLVNLYTPSTVKLALAGENTVTIRQETKYPQDGTVVLNVDPAQPAEFKLQLRVPRWCDTPAAAVNGERLSAEAKPGEFLTINRRWQAGDSVRLELPMKWRLVKGRQAQAGRVAVMRGPLVFGLNRARHEKLAKVDLRLIVIDPDTLQEPVADDSVHPGGLACRLQAWEPGAWYPMSKKTLDLTLTEFADPAGEAVYFKVPDPKAAGLVDDELSSGVFR
ncbi:MAG TPA: glycoside hydrolase family 127 protein, partial [Candidatus Anammoximicrobium sp.]|nr:glycoside hydrolase family 127 protein [Candidatus Anammoximicrobium sp.]